MDGLASVRTAFVLSSGHIIFVPVSLCNPARFLLRIIWQFFCENATGDENSALANGRTSQIHKNLVGLPRRQQQISR